MFFSRLTRIVAAVAVCISWLGLTVESAAATDTLCGSAKSGVAWVVRDFGSPAGLAGANKFTRHVKLTNCQTGKETRILAKVSKVRATVGQSPVGAADYTSTGNRMCMQYTDRGAGSYQLTVGGKPHWFITAQTKTGQWVRFLQFDFTTAPSNFQAKNRGEVIWIPNTGASTTWSSKVAC